MGFRRQFSAWIRQISAVGIVALGGETLGQVAVDLNGDGVGDSVRRELRIHATEPVVSRVVFVSGVDGAEILPVSSKTPSDLFGWFVAPIGDFDGDGIEDLAVTAPAALLEAERGPEHPAGPRAAWRGRVDLISGAGGSLIQEIANPEATFDLLFGTGAAAVPDQDGDGLPDLVVAGLEIVAAPTAEEPEATGLRWRWWVMSTGTAEAIRVGVGMVGAPGCEFLLPAPPGETVDEFWWSNSVAGEDFILPGLPGDLDADGDVDEDDAVALVGQWTSDPTGSGGRLGDLTGDGTVNGADLAVLFGQFGWPAEFAEGFEGADDPAGVMTAAWTGQTWGNQPDLRRPRGPGRGFNGPMKFSFSGGAGAHAGAEGGDEGGTGCGTSCSCFPCSPGCGGECNPACGANPCAPPCGGPCSPGCGGSPCQCRGEGCGPGDPLEVDDAPTAEVVVTIGDPSGSHSESWAIHIGSIVVEAAIGEIITETIELQKNMSYTVRVEHLGSNQNPPDYDYRATITSRGCSLVIDDPDGLLGSFNEVDVAGVELKRAAVAFVRADLRMDFDGDGSISSADEQEENNEGTMIVLADTFDADSDGWPDFADGYDLYAGAAGSPFTIDDACDGAAFEPVELTLWLPDTRGWLVRIDYSASDPLGVGSTQSEPLIPALGHLRLWMRDASEPRDGRAVLDGGDYLAPGIYTPEELGFPTGTPWGGQTTMYAEAVRESALNQARIDVSIVEDTMVPTAAFGACLVDRVGVTTTRMVLEGRGLGQAEWRSMAGLITTSLDDPADPMPTGYARGAWCVNRLRVFDPRDAIDTASVAGDPLVLARIGGEYVSEEFMCLPPPGERPPGAVPPSIRIIEVQSARTLLSYNPEAYVPSPGDLEALHRAEADLAIEVDRQTQLFHDSGWVSENPGDSGYFGKRIHENVTVNLNARDGLLMNVYVDRATNQITWIGPGDPPPALRVGKQQLDAVILVDPSYRPQVGDVYEASRCAARDIKTGMHARPSSIAYLDGFCFDGKGKMIRGRYTYEPSTNRMIEHPKWKAVTVLFGVLGAAQSVHAFVSTEWQNDQIEEIERIQNNFDAQSDLAGRRFAALRYAEVGNALMGSFFSAIDNGSTTMVDVGLAFKALTGNY